MPPAPAPPGRFQLKEAKEALAASRKRESDLKRSNEELRAKVESFHGLRALTEATEETNANLRAEAQDQARRCREDREALDITKGALEKARADCARRSPGSGDDPPKLGRPSGSSGPRPRRGAPWTRRRGCANSRTRRLDYLVGRERAAEVARPEQAKRPTRHHLRVSAKLQDRGARGPRKMRHRTRATAPGANPVGRRDQIISC